jgi:signal transduction histidine kinase
VHRRVQELALVLASDRSHQLELEVAPDLEAVVDPTAFDRIVSNLITNAFKYGEPPVLVSADHSDDHFRLSVEDRGGGVPAEFVPDLFERFTRETSTARREHGAGLGLSIAQQYAQAHGGVILYRAAAPQGARFELVLPLSA